MFVKMCEVRKYAPGDIIDLSLGGICFRGGFKEMGQDIDQAEKTISKIETEQKKLEFKFKDSLQVKSQSHNNASYLASRKQIAKRTSIRDLGLVAKNIGLKGINQQEGQQGVTYIKANPSKQNAHVAHSDNYVIIMHFGEIVSQAIENGLTEDVIDQAF